MMKSAAEMYLLASMTFGMVCAAPLSDSIGPKRLRAASKGAASGAKLAAVMATEVFSNLRRSMEKRSETFRKYSVGHKALHASEGLALSLRLLSLITVAYWTTLPRSLAGWWRFASAFVWMQILNMENASRLSKNDLAAAGSKWR